MNEDKCRVIGRRGNVFCCDKVLAGREVALKMSTPVQGEKSPIETWLCEACAAPWRASDPERFRGDVLIKARVSIPAVVEEIPANPDDTYDDLANVVGTKLIDTNGVIEGSLEEIVDEATEPATVDEFIVDDEEGEAEISEHPEPVEFAVNGVTEDDAVEVAKAPVRRSLKRGRTAVPK